MTRDAASSALNIALGLFLAGTALLWPHDGANLVSSLAVGALAVAVGLASLAGRGAPAFWLDLPLAAWLAASIWLLPHRLYAGWSEAMVVIGLALVPITMLLFPEEGAPRERRAHA